MEDRDIFGPDKMINQDAGEVTLLLHAMRRGDTQAAESLLPLVYQELHRLASSYMRRERTEHTLQTTALINEAYLRMAQRDTDWQNRAHFIGFAAHVMRQVLVDHARTRQAEVHGGRAQRVELVEGLAISLERTEEMLILDEALERLAQQNARQAKVVELRYFGGLSVDEIGEVLGIAPRSVKRDWSLARLWLFRQLQSTTKAEA